MLQPLLVAIISLVLIGISQAAPQTVGRLVVVVRSNTGPIEQAEVSARERTEVTDDAGVASFDLPAGSVDLKVERYGIKSRTVQATVVQGETTRITIDVETESVSDE